MKSVMMVTYNRLELTKQTVENIYKTTNDFNFIIVDNGSSDGTVDYLKELKLSHNNVYLNLWENNKGIASGRNKALQIANELNTEWYSTIDNDILLPVGWMDSCINVLKSNLSYGMIGVSFEPVTYQHVHLNGHHFESKPQGNLGTACTVFGKNLHKMIGYFTTEYEKYGEEDADFGMRARIAGFKLGYLIEHGVHLGEGEVDKGEYREFKDECRRNNLALFHQNCRDYSSGKKSIYLPYKDK